jgi:hypothetical protein
LKKKLKKKRLTLACLFYSDILLVTLFTFFAFAFGVARGREGERVGRGENEWTDTMQSEGIAKNERIANAGNSEMATGQFAQSTKNREGAVPGDQDPRRV